MTAGQDNIVIFNEDQEAVISQHVNSRMQAYASQTMPFSTANAANPTATMSQRSDFKINKSAKKKRVFKTDIRTCEKQTKAERMESGNDMMYESLEANTEAAA